MLFFLLIPLHHFFTDKHIKQNSPLTLTLHESLLCGIGNLVFKEYYESTCVCMNGSLLCGFGNLVLKEYYECTCVRVRTRAILSV